MNERDALLKAVYDNPDDDAPRLVFADWLDEHDEPERAEFIRLQIEIAGLPEGKKKQKKQEREKELLKAHQSEWAEPLAEFGSYLSDTPWEFRRGFVEAMMMDEEVFVEEGGRIFDLAPIREVALPEAEDYEELPRCKHLLKLHTLDLTGARLITEFFEVAKLLRSKYLANLTTLLARGHDDNGHLDAGGLNALADTKHLTKLVVLDLSGNWMFGPHSGAARAAGCRKALVKLGANKPALRELRMRGTSLHDADLIALSEQPWVSQLRVLDLSRNDFTEAGCRALCESKHFANLESVNASGISFYDGETSTDVPLSDAAKKMLKERFGKRVTL